MKEMNTENHRSIENDCKLSFKIGNIEIKSIYK